MTPYLLKKSSIPAALPLALISGFLFLVISCGGSDQTGELHYSTALCLESEATCDVNGFLASLLSQSTIVMIGDMEPGVWRHRDALVEFLDYWSEAPEDSFATSFADLRDLTLVMELDSLQLERARAYMESWDFADLASSGIFCSEQFSSADLEFYLRLGNVLHRVARRNHDSEDTSRVNLTLLAGQPNSDRLKRSPEELGRYFVSERDLAVANRIAEYHETRPESRLLGFCNVEKLYRGRWRKDFAGQSDSTYCVASYLDSLWDGKANISTVDQANRSTWPFAFWEGQPECSFIVPCDKVLDALIIGEAAHMLLFDAVIVRYEDHYELHLPMKAIPSTHVARLMIAEMENFSDSASQGDESPWATLLTYLHAISGVAPQSVNDSSSTLRTSAIRSWQDWAAGPEPDIVAEVTSLRLWSRLIDSLEVAPAELFGPYDGEIMSILPEAPPFDNRFGAPSPADRAAQLREYLTDHRSRIVQRTLINLLWVGSELEKQNALAALVHETGLDYGTPSEWSRWFRSGGEELWE